MKSGGGGWAHGCADCRGSRGRTADCRPRRGPDTHRRCDPETRVGLGMILKAERLRGDDGDSKDEPLPPDRAGGRGTPFRGSLRSGTTALNRQGV